ncbi:hypothetical protein N7495_002081 [Penicillium taxi]|uniref:uncharacterized protein n=1 Tax=Penicillium taxi TaxID=168475 RepID=UPI0025452767|nr:uncharacterized protein N7495_002081 [Penicillium taxi]KAJ5901553.1 hypothetical protein N7495_002081 [Penicillium taxi]
MKKEIKNRKREARKGPKIKRKVETAQREPPKVVLKDKEKISAPKNEDLGNKDQIESSKSSKNVRWKYEGDEPLNDWTKLPPGWTNLERDLDPQDLEAQIQRCHERIEENMMTYIFENRLKYAPYKDLKLPWSVIKRIKILDSIHEMTKKDGDPLEEISNIQAIIEAYKSETIKLDGLVTYWSHGKLVGGPKEFTVEEFREVNRANKGHKGFWVEGFEFCLRLGPDLANSANPERAYAPIELEFRDDTGADVMLIFRDDLEILQGPPPPDILPGQSRVPFEQVMGLAYLGDASQQNTATPIYLVEVNMYNLRVADDGDENRRFLKDEWTPIRCAVNQTVDSITEDGQPRQRLSGPWMRRQLYQATAPEPERDRHAYISTDKNDLMDILPDIDVSNETYERRWPWKQENSIIGGAIGELEAEASRRERLRRRVKRVLGQGRTDPQYEYRLVGIEDIPERLPGDNIQISNARWDAGTNEYKVWTPPP